MHYSYLYLGWKAGTEYQDNLPRLQSMNFEEWAQEWRGCFSASSLAFTLWVGLWFHHTVYSIPKENEIKDVGPTQCGRHQQTPSLCLLYIRIARAFKMLGRMVLRVLLLRLNSSLEFHGQVNHQLMCEHHRMTPGFMIYRYHGLIFFYCNFLHILSVRKHRLHLTWLAMEWDKGMLW